MMLHAADISNPAKPRLHYFEWTDRVLAEFYAQGDKERALGDEGPGISTFFDREKPNVIKCQSGFIGFIVRPLFEFWSEYVPSLKPHCMPHVEANQALWGADAAPTEWYYAADRLYIDDRIRDWDGASADWAVVDGAVGRPHSRLPEPKPDGGDSSKEGTPLPVRPFDAPRPSDAAPRPSDAGAVALLPGDDVEAALETKSDSRRPSKAAPKYDKNGRLIKPVAVAEPKF